MNAMRTDWFAITVLLLSVTGAAAQLPPPTVVTPIPNPNPSSSLVLPPPHQVPVSPAPGAGQLSSLRPYPPTCSVFSPHSCYPSVCSVFHHGPCLPYYLPPIGQDLRLTIVSTDENPSRAENKSSQRTSILSTRSATCLPRCVPAGFHRPKGRRITVWNTPSASHLSAMAR